MRMRIVAYQQLETSDCGITCIRIVARYYGKKIPLKTLREMCDVSRIGISLRDILNCTQTLGFRSAAVKVTEKEIAGMPLPAILYWKQSHYVVLYKIDKKSRYYILDPSFGKMRFEKEEFMQYWKGDSRTGLAVVMDPTADFYSKTYKNDNVHPKLFRLLKDSVSAHKGKFSWVVIFTLIGMIADAISPLLFQKTIDAGIGEKNLQLVWVLILGQFAFFLGNYISNNIVEIILAKLGLRLSIDLLKEYLNKLIRLPISFFDVKVNSDLIQKLDDQNRMKNFLVHMPDHFFFACIHLVVFSGMLIYYNYLIFLLVAFSSALALLWTRLFLRKRREIDYSYFSYQSANRNHIYELIYGMPEIKINNAQQIRVAVWNKTQEKINDLSLRSVFVKFCINSGNVFLLRLKDILITGICATLVIYDQMTIGVMMTITYLVGRLTSPVSQLVDSVSSIQDASMSYERLDEIVHYPDVVGAGGRSLSPDRIHIGMILEDVSFKYPGSHSPYVLKNIHTLIPAGKVTAIVGASGSGKSTLIKLLLGFYTPQSGHLRIDDRPLTSLEADEWLKHCGVVMQSGYIFSGTLMENIALSDPDPDPEKVRKAAQMACIADFFETLPMGYNTKIGVAGLELSGGQKQRLFIARAIYKDPPFVFLDEATSSLDANNEQEILRNMTDFYRGKTVVIVAHRLSTVRNADKIIFLDRGGDHGRGHA